MSQKLTVKDVAHLLEDNGLIEIIFENDTFWDSYNGPRYEIDELVTKYGNRVVTWITHAPEDGDERLTIELEGERE